MNKLFRPKTMRRMAVFMALVAPIIYLFGSLFFALNGAHGQVVFAEQETTYVDMDVTYNGVVFDRVFYFSESHGFDSNSVNGEFFLDEQYITVNSSVASYTGFEDGVVSYPILSVTTYSDGGVAYKNLTSDKCFSMVIGNEWYAEFIGLYVYVYQQGTNYERYYTNGTFGVSYRSHPVSFDPFVGDVFTEEHRHIPVYQPTVVVEPAQNNNEYVFGQFFTKDNFLVDWGQNAISEDPHGFAPFGYFWRYLDTNVLHLSNEQVGLMAYGYMFYAAHVLLFDVGFILVTFFLTFIQKVADKIGGEDHA